MVIPGFVMPGFVMPGIAVPDLGVPGFVGGGGLLPVVVASMAVVLALPLLVAALWPRRDGAARRLDYRAGMSEFRQRQLSSSFVDRLAAPLLQDIAHYARKVTPRGVVDGTAHKLVIAGLANRIPLEALLAGKALLGAGGLFAATGFTSGMSLLSRIVMVGLAGLVGFVIPDAYVSRKAGERQVAIGNALPEMLDQLSVVIEAGLGFDSALSRIVESSSGPLTDEFARSLGSIRLGRSRSEALQEIADRTDVAEVRQFVGAVKQADSLGVPMARIVRAQADHMRQLKRLAAEEKAMRLPVKLTLPMVLCMLPSLFVVLIGPVVIRVMEGF